MVLLTDFAIELAFAASGTPRYLPAIAGAAIDATSTAPTLAAARTTIGWEHVVGSGATLLVVDIPYAGGGSITTSSVTWNGVPMLKKDQAKSSTNVNNRLVDRWYLVCPAPGRGTIMVTQSGSNDCDASAISFTGTDLVNPFGTVVKVQAATGTSASLGTINGAFVLAAASVRSTTTLTATGTPTTVLNRITGGSSNDANASVYKATSLVAGFTWSVSDENAALAHPINAATWTNLTPVGATSYLRIADGMTFTRGRQSEQTALASPGTGALALRNNDARFTPNNGSSPYAPVQIRRPVRCRVTYSATTYNRWQAFVDDWGSASDSNYGIARVQLSDRLARTVKNKFTSAVDAEILSDNPTAYYPLSDQSGATGAGDLSTLTNPALPAIGAVAFGTATTVGPDKQSGAGVGAGYLAGAVPSLVFPFGLYSGSIEAVITVGSIPATNLLFAGTSLLSLSLQGSGRIDAQMGPLGLDYHVYSSASGGDIVAGGTYHIVATWTWATSGTGSLTLYVNGVQVGTTVTSPGLWNTTAFGGATGLFNVGNGITATLAVSNVAVYGYALTAARIADHASGILTSWSGESTDARFQRVCRVAGLPSTAYNVVATSSIPMGAQPLAGRALSDALNDIATTENGPIYVDQAGVLKFAPRTARYRQTATLTLDASKPGQVLSGAIPVTNDSYLVNDSTVTRSGGAAQRDVDQTSINSYDAKDEQLTIYTSRDDVAGNLAQWHVLSFKDAPTRPRFDQPLEIDVVAFANSGGNVAALLNTDVGTKITVTNLAAHQVPSGTVSLFVEGVADVFTKDTWVIRLVTSPIALEDSVFVIDSSVIDGPDLIAY